MAHNLSTSSSVHFHTIAIAVLPYRQPHNKDALLFAVVKMLCNTFCSTCILY